MSTVCSNLNNINIKFVAWIIFCKISWRILEVFQITLALLYSNVFDFHKTPYVSFFYKNYTNKKYRPVKTVRTVFTQLKPIIYF